MFWLSLSHIYKTFTNIFNPLQTHLFNPSDSGCPCLIFNPLQTYLTLYKHICLTLLVLAVPV